MSGQPADVLEGVTIEGGALQLVETLRGTTRRGQHRARRAGASGGLCLVTIAPPGYPLEEIHRELSLPRVQGVAPLRHVGRARGGAVVVVEDEPAGEPLGSGRRSAFEVRSIGAQLFDVLDQVHGAGRALGGLRPEVVYGTTSTAHGVIVTGAAPRGARLLQATPPSDAPGATLAPLFDALYAAPEELDGAPPSPAGDVFTVACMLGHLALGAHPFDGDDSSAQLVAIVNGRRRPDLLGLGAPEALLDQAMEGDPARRPSAKVLRDALMPFTFVDVDPY